MNERESIELAVQELVDQPDLFSADKGGIEAAAMAVDAPLVFAAGTVRRQVTGERVSKDQARALLIGALKMRGASDRRIAEAVGCDRRTIARVMERLEAQGVVPPLKDRLAAKVGRLSEAVSDELNDIVQDGRWDRDTTAALKGLAVALGITTEKALLLTGQATEIRANTPAGGKVLSPEELQAWVAGSAPAAGTCDSESDVSGQNAPVYVGSAAVDTRVDTAAPALEVGAVAWPTGRRQADPVRAEPTPGEGGVRVATTLPTINGSGDPRNFDHGGNHE